MRFLKIPEGVKQQAGPDQQERGKSHFAGDQPAGQLATHGARAEAAGARL